jgi:hypothetical protein
VSGHKEQLIIGHFKLLQVHLLASGAFHHEKKEVIRHAVGNILFIQR